MSAALIRLLEATGSAVPGRFLIRVIQGGPSLNGNVYPAAVLREAAPRFDGARVFVKSDAEHIAGSGKDVRNLIGRLSEARFVEAEGVGGNGAHGEIQAVLTLLSPEGEIGQKLREAVAGGMTDLFGFSVDVTGSTRRAVVGGKVLREAVRITQVSSVDLIVEPGAGGRLIRMVEAVEVEEAAVEAAEGAAAAANVDFSGDDEMRLRELLLQQLREAAPAVHARLASDATDEEIGVALREALGRPVDPANAAIAARGAPTPPAGDSALAVRLVEARMAMRETVAASTLPAAAKTRLTEAFAGRAEVFDAHEVTAAIERERAYLASFREANVRVPGADVSLEDRSTRIAGMLDAFFDPAHAEHRNTHSFREAYVEITGDRRVSGRVEDCDRGRMAESLGVLREALDSTSFASALGSAMNRRMVADYRSESTYGAWRQIAQTVPVMDFRTQERVRVGGYGDIPGVAESAAYLALTSPDDEKASYAVTKRGGIETVTLEMVRNDDVGVVRRIPVAMSRAAQRTLAKFVFDFLRSNAAIYDAKALFHADHGNLGAAALSAASLAAGRLAMLKQAERDSNVPLGIGPRHLLVPVDLEEAAVDLFRRNTNQDKTFAQSLALNVIPVWYWADTTDWCLAADPADIPTIEVGFLDGREEPELFVQDAPTVGSLFSNDAITYKLRHIYGGTVVDYRGLYKAVVA